MNIADFEQYSEIMTTGYKSATGLRCFGFVLGSVFARTLEDAEQIANQSFMRGDDAMTAFKQLCQDCADAIMRQDVEGWDG
jgi:hypothetical protein